MGLSPKTLVLTTVKTAPDHRGALLILPIIKINKTFLLNKNSKNLSHIIGTWFPNKIDLLEYNLFSLHFEVIHVRSPLSSTNPPHLCLLLFLKWWRWFLKNQEIKQKCNSKSHCKSIKLQWPKFETLMACKLFN